MTERKHILVVGAGAIGGLYAAYLAKVADVAVLDTNRAHVEAIRQNGLKLTGCTESVAKLAAFASAAEMGRRRFDAAIVLVHGEDSWLGPARGKVESIVWLGELMTRSGLPTKVVADPRGAIWGKFIFNSVMNPIGAIVQGVNAARYEVPEMRALIDDMAAE